MPTDPLFIISVIAANIVISEWLVRYTFFRHFGTALLVIVVTAVTANLGLIPTSTSSLPADVYGGVFTYVAPLAIFWLMLQVNLRDIIRAGLPMLLAFAIGAAGTLAGVLVGMWAINGPERIGELYRPLGGMFVGTYTGGSVNFSTIALHYDVVRHGTLYGAATAADNVMTAVWMAATIALPRALSGIWPGHHAIAAGASAGHGDTAIDEDSEFVHPIDLSLLIAAGAMAVWLSEWLAGWLADQGVTVPSILILTTIALVGAQVPFVSRLRGAKLLGMFAVYFFLATIGALCDLTALSTIGQLAVTLLVFITIVIGVHGLVSFALGAALRIDPHIVAVASQANIGGGPSALALARSLGRVDLTVPAVLVGSLGYGIGTYLGFFAAGHLL